jgi:hypothetical protein
MLVQFNVPRGIDQINYRVGVHTLDDSLADHPYFKLLLKDGDVSVLETPRVTKEEVKVEAEAEASKEEKSTKAKKEA